MTAPDGIDLGDGALKEKARLYCGCELCKDKGFCAAAGISYGFARNERDAAREQGRREGVNEACDEFDSAGERYRIDGWSAIADAIDRLSYRVRAKPRVQCE